MVQKMWSSMAGKNRSLAVIAVAMVMAIMASVWAYNILNNRSPVQKVETVPVTVAAVDLPWGMVITRETTKTVPYLKDNLPTGSFSEPAFIDGRTVLYPVKANEPILASRLAPIDIKGGGVAAVVSPGKRAMAVKVDKFVGVSGFIHPGNRVDVLVALTGQGKIQSPVAKTVLENVLVLATGSEIEQAEKKEKAVPVDVITLEVSPEEAEKLALATKEGSLQMALRNFTDTRAVITRGATIPVLLSSYSVSPAPKVVEKKAIVRRPATVRSEPQSVTVELVLGSEVEQLRFGKGE
jgi:pilus assembly protein CpaB